MTLTPDDKNKIEDEFVCREALRILESMRHPDVSDLADDSKELVFDRIRDKVKAESIRCVNRNKRRITWLFLKAACIGLLLSLSVGAGYWIGYEKDKKVQAGVPAEAITPLGVVSRITLSDGTIVTLNGGSKLTYPTLFFGKERHVTLSGEGFFEVAKDHSHPFIVSSDKLSVRVLGTKFGFKSYKEDAHTMITLAEGSVKAIPLSKKAEAGIILEPNQQLVLDNHTGEFLCRNVDTKEYVSWKNGELYFRNNTLEDITRILERKFNVTVRILSDELRNECYYAHFVHGENAGQILKLLSFKRPWSFENKKDTIEIKKK